MTQRTDRHGRSIDEVNTLLKVLSHETNVKKAVQNMNKSVSAKINHVYHNFKETVNFFSVRSLYYLSVSSVCCRFIYCILQLGLQVDIHSCMQENE